MTQCESGLTLDVFSRIMDYPPWEFMGVMADYECSPLVPISRARIVEAEANALDMISGEIKHRGRSLFDQNVKLTSRYSYFKLDGYTSKVMTSKQYQAAISVDTATGDYTTYIATLTATVDELGACDELYCVRVVWPDHTHLGVEFLTDPSIASTLLTVTARAYNFIDLSDFDGTIPPDAISYLREVTIEVTTIANAIPKALWDPGCCVVLTPDACLDDECRFIVTDGCLREGEDGLYDVRDYWQTCISPIRPKRFEVTVLQPGLWEMAFSDAVVSLANTRLPSDFCGCNKLVNNRFLDDNGMSERYNKVYPYSFNNGFGILAPGAQYAWKTIDRVVSNTIVIKE